MPRPDAPVRSPAELPLDERIERFTGCLLGGALGDTLGAPVEFLDLPGIRARFGPNGIEAPSPAYGRVGAITDDTQMTLFTAEGLLRAHNRFLGKGLSHVPSVVRHAYLRWLHTQGERDAWRYFFDDRPEPWPDGWLVSLPDLHERRSPGNTCLSALRSRRMGEVSTPLNDSKGCGAVMRSAPVGLVPVDDPFGDGCELAALTHGHPSGYLAAGFLAHLVRSLVCRLSLDDALDAALAELVQRPGHEECLQAVTAARELAASPPTAETVERLGAGWVAEEALAIAVLCALSAKDFEHGVRLAVNHGGDSDSTGAIAGNLLGAQLGKSALPPAWLEQLELRDAIEQLAVDLARHHDPPTSRSDWDADFGDLERYPGW